eukprot:TRINITY_DN10638_c0_g1_i1.p1 TRINITY_DN10638_c0_g1~~TRINITY_DN10638_c0_g1_i1.p1  ORF type:complete len:839 (+),score=153.78 TRINITY_DN10638_c0_g1_i1:289-2517(+)
MEASSKEDLVRMNAAEKRTAADVPETTHTWQSELQTTTLAEFLVRGAQQSISIVQDLLADDHRFRNHPERSINSMIDQADTTTPEGFSQELSLNREEGPEPGSVMMTTTDSEKIATFDSQEENPPLQSASTVKEDESMRQTSSSQASAPNGRPGSSLGRKLRFEKSLHSNEPENGHSRLKIVSSRTKASTSCETQTESLESPSHGMSKQTVSFKIRDSSTQVENQASADELQGARTTQISAEAWMDRYSQPTHKIQGNHESDVGSQANPVSNFQYPPSSLSFPSTGQDAISPPSFVAEILSQYFQLGRNTLRSPQPTYPFASYPTVMEPNTHSNPIPQQQMYMHELVRLNQNGQTHGPSQYSHEQYGHYSGFSDQRNISHTFQDPITPYAFQTPQNQMDAQRLVYADFISPRSEANPQLSFFSPQQVPSEQMYHALGDMRPRPDLAGVPFDEYHRRSPQVANHIAEGFPIETLKSGHYDNPLQSHHWDQSSHYVQPIQSTQHQHQSFPNHIPIPHNHHAGQHESPFYPVHNQTNGLSYPMSLPHQAPHRDVAEYPPPPLNYQAPKPRLAPSELYGISPRRTRPTNSQQTTVSASIQTANVSSKHPHLLSRASSGSGPTNTHQHGNPSEHRVKVPPLKVSAVIPDPDERIGDSSARNRINIAQAISARAEEITAQELQVGDASQSKMLQKLDEQQKIRASKSSKAIQSQSIQTDVRPIIPTKPILVSKPSAPGYAAQLRRNKS